jgi:hypothetical protein
MNEGPGEVLSDDDTDLCEACSRLVPIEDTVLMCDCVYCTACTEKWQAVFNACQHEWEPSTDPGHGDPGRYCRRCSGFVADEFPL